MTNYYTAWGAQSPADKYYNPDPMQFQHPGIGIAIAKSGGGKSNLACGVVLPRAKQFTSQFEKIAAFRGVEADDFLYDMLEEKLGPAHFTIEPLSGLPDWVSRKAEEFDAVNRDITRMPQTMVLIDDFLVGGALEKTVSSFPTYCRKWNCSLLLLTQSYVDTDKLMRKQLQYWFCLRGLPARTVSLVIQDANPGTDVSEDRIKAMYKLATKGGAITDWFLIDTVAPPDAGLTFRKGFDHPFRPVEAHRPPPFVSKAAGPAAGGSLFDLFGK